MPGSVHSGSDLAGAASLATVLLGLWIGERLLLPILQLKDCSREVQASLVVAFSLRNTVACLAGNDDIGALDALGDARRDLSEEAERLEALAGRSSPLLRLYLWSHGYRLELAVHALRRLSNSRVAERESWLMNQAAVEAALRLGTERGRGRIRPPLRFKRG